MPTPTERTLAFLRKAKMTAGVVEKWNSHARIRQDFLGFADIIAAADDRGILAVQATSGSNMASRVTKVRAEPRASDWLRSGGRIWVMGWRQIGKPKKWTPRIIEILHDGEEVEVTEL